MCPRHKGSILIVSEVSSQQQNWWGPEIIRIGWKQRRYNNLFGTIRCFCCCCCCCCCYCRLWHLPLSLYTSFTVSVNGWRCCNMPKRHTENHRNSWSLATLNVTNPHTHWQTDTHTQKDTHTKRHTHKKTHKKTHTHTHTHKHTHTHTQTNTHARTHTPIQT